MNRLDMGISIQAAEGWKVDRLAGPSPLFGANGMKVRPDGKLVVAQAFGSQVSVVDVESGECEPICERGGEVVGPDDVALDTHGNLFITEVMSARVSARFTDGTTRVVAGDVPCANGITSHGDRVFMDEFRPGGRVLELYVDGRAPRVIARDMNFPNALAMGPDDHLYFPAVVDGEIWRVPVGGGTAERFVTGLDHPTAVKFDGKGRLHTVQAGNGEIARFDLQTREKTRFAQVRRGIDNFAFSPDGRFFLSWFTDGGVSEIVAGSTERTIVGSGFVGPFDIATSPSGSVFVADGLSLAEIRPDGTTVRRGQLLEAGWPGVVRGVAVGADGAVFVANSAGDLVRLLPGPAEVRASGLGATFGLAVAPDGRVLAADADGGRVVAVDARGEVTVVARGLSRPLGVAVSADGAIYASESAKGRVVRVDGGTTTVLDGLREPHGVAITNGALYAVDRAARELVTIALDSRKRTTIASGLAVGEAQGVVPKPLPGLPGMLPGPIGCFAGLAVLADGTLCVSADGEGSVLRVWRP